MGFPYYITAACLDLALLQEQATLNQVTSPDNYKTFINQPGVPGEIASTAEVYRKFSGTKLA